MLSGIIPDMFLPGKDLHSTDTNGHFGSEKRPFILTRSGTSKDVDMDSCQHEDHQAQSSLPNRGFQVFSQFS